MITGQIKNQIDQIWDTFWESAGITNPMSVLEQMTYLFFMKLLDDAERQREKISQELDLGELDNPTFPLGLWHNPDSNEDVSGQSLRWHNFKQLDPDTMFRTILRVANQADENRMGKLCSTQTSTYLQSRTCPRSSRVHRVCYSPRVLPFSD